MIIMAHRTGAVGTQGPGAVAEHSRLCTRKTHTHTHTHTPHMHTHKARETGGRGIAWTFEISECDPSDILPPSGTHTPPNSSQTVPAGDQVIK